MLNAKRLVPFIFFVLFTSSAFGTSAADIEEPLQFFKSYYSKEELKEIYKRTTQALIEIEKKTRYPSQLSIEKTSYNFPSFPFINEAHAAKGVDGKCFFGGWLTNQTPNWCNEPWKHASDPQAKELGPTYDSASYCGGKNLFRCNPVLFGMPKDHDPKLGKNPDRGICIEIDSYKHVTAMCVKEATKHIDNYIDVLSKDPKKLEQFLGHATEILNYCDKDKLNYCEGLKAYLQKITKKAEDCAKARVEATLPKVVPRLNNDIIKVTEKLIEKEEPKPVVEVTPEPIIEPKPKPIIVEKPKEDTIRPVERPEIDPLTQKILAYSNDPRTQRMIDRMREIYRRNCNARGCRGSKGNVPGGACWRYVKHGLMKGSYADGYLEKHKQSYPYTPTASAKNAGKEFFETKEVGFTNLLKTDKYKNLSSADAPVGAVLVYSGGKHGHVEVKASQSEYISDYRAGKPTDKTSAYRAKTRKLVGIYVKVD